MPTATPPHAVRVSAGPATVDVTADDEAVTNWIIQYFGSWWTVQPTAHQSAAELDGPVLCCRIHPDSYTVTQDSVGSRMHRVVEFARKPLQVVDAGGAICAVDPAERVAYHADADHTHITLVAAESLGLCLAAARITRELIRVQLEADGWAILHASAPVRDGNAVLALGSKGAGKTTSALLLTAHGHQLLANDRVFMHPTTRALLPWPAAAALGLGLLHAHGLLEGVRARLAAGQQLHPTVDPAVTAAILGGRISSLHDQRGRELKPQFFPHQLVDWLGLHLARSAVATTLLFPHVDPDSEPANPASRPSPASSSAPTSSTPTTTTATQTSCASPELPLNTATRSGPRPARRWPPSPTTALVLNHDTARSGQLLATTSAGWAKS